MSWHQLNPGGYLPSARIGQAHKVHVHRLIAKGTVDELTVSRNTEKTLVERAVNV